MKNHLIAQRQHQKKTRHICSKNQRITIVQLRLQPNDKTCLLRQIHYNPAETGLFPKKYVKKRPFHVIFWRVERNTYNNTIGD